MRIFLRKHFWVVNLATISLCALFAARAVGRLAGSSLPPPPQKKGLPALPVAGPSAVSSGAREITAVLNRNIFCSICEKVVETPTKSGDGDKGEPSNNEPVKTSLNLKLVATLVSEEDKAWSFAAIIDPTDGSSRLYAIGSKVPGDAVVTDVLDRRVLLHNGNRNEFLDLDTGQGTAVAQAQPTAEVAVRPGGGNSMEDEVAKSIRKVGEGKYELERSALNKVLANTTLLARSARIVPSVKDGQPNGFKLYAIRPGSLYSLLGMANGDTINAINGHAMTTPDAALEIYTKLRNASHVTISYTRGTKTQTNEYTIR
jgi:general secretion pathway protein C